MQRTGGNGCVELCQAVIMTCACDVSGACCSTKVDEYNEGAEDAMCCQTVCEAGTMKSFSRS